MKTQPTILLILLLLLTACGGDGGETPDEPATDSIAIGMSVDGVVQSVTRAGATELTNAVLQEKGFGVYAWYTGTSDFTTPAASIYMLMRNQKIGYTDGHSPWPWHYSPAKYWPLNDAEKVTFRAYAPYQQYMPVDGSGLPVFPIHLGGTEYDGDQQIDPLWGTAKDGALYQDWTRPADNTIHWHFRHGMAKIVFNAQLGEDFMLPDGGYVVVNSITLDGLYSDGALNLEQDGWLVDGRETHTYYDDNKHYPNPKWTDREGSITATVTPEATTQVTKAAMTSLMPTDGTGLLVIPIAYTSGRVLTLTVTFAVYDKDGKKSTDGVNTATLPLDGATAGALHGNTVYNFNMELALTSKDLQLTIVVDKNWQVGVPFNQTI